MSGLEDWGYPFKWDFGPVGHNQDVKHILEIVADGIPLKGRVIAVERDAKTGGVLGVHVTNNLVVNEGRVRVALALVSAVSSELSYVGVGSGTNSPAASDTDLQTPLGSRKQITHRWRSGNTAKFSTFFDSTDNNGTWNECGIFADASGGAMFARALFTDRPIAKDNSKTITVDWEIQVG
jgi:hypothetical protein